MKEIIFHFLKFIEGEIKFQIQHIGKTKERWVENDTKPMREFKVVKSKEMTIHMESFEEEEMYEGNFQQ